MTGRFRPTFLACAGLALALLAPSLASARDPGGASSCSDAYESGQRLRKKGALRASRHELVVCAREGCPSALASDCLRWLGEVEAALPTVVVAVVDSAGRDVVDARVSFDDATSLEPADGRAVDVDPGRHRIRVVSKDRTTIEEEIVVREGEKRRAVRITLPSALADASKKEEPRAAAPSEPSHTAAWVFFGLGAASLASAGGLGLYGLSQRSDLERCRPGCDAGAVDSANRTFLVSDILLAVGLVAAGAGAFFYLQTPPSTTAQAVAGRR